MICVTADGEGAGTMIRCVIRPLTPFHCYTNMPVRDIRHYMNSLTNVLRIEVTKYISDAPIWFSDLQNSWYQQPIWCLHFPKIIMSFLKKNLLFWFTLNKNNIIRVSKIQQLVNYWNRYWCIRLISDYRLIISALLKSIIKT